MKKLTKALMTILVATQITGATAANAAWKQDSNGWWNTKGCGYSIGWENIDGQWYYFGQDGYMKTGWIKDGDKWYFLDKVTGAMLSNTTVDGHTLDSTGAWINADCTTDIDIMVNNATSQKEEITYNPLESLDFSKEKSYVTVFYNKETLEVDTVLRGIQTPADFYNISRQHMFNPVYVNLEDVGLSPKSIGELQFENKIQVILKNGTTEVIFED